MSPHVRRLFLPIPLLLGLAAEARPQAPPEPAVYRVDASSRLVVKTGKAGLFGFAGHTHVIRARRMSGAIQYRPGTTASSLRIEVPTDDLEVLTPPDTAEIRKVTEAMRTDVLHVAKYPTMTFAAESVEARNGKVELRLAVTMHGTTRTVPVTADVTVGGDTVRARGVFQAKQTDFGITPYRGGPAGTVKVADQVTFCFDLVAVRGSTAGPGRPADLEDLTGVPGCVDKFRPAPARPM